MAGEFVVALALAGSSGSTETEALIRQASLVRKEWLQETSTEITHVYDAASQSVKALECRKYQAIVLSEKAVPADPEAAFPLLVEALERQDWDETSRQLLRRAEKAGFKVDLVEMRRRACLGQLRLPRLQLRDYLSPAVLRETGRLCPETIPIPSGRRARLDYDEDGCVRLRVKLQELFGLQATPCVGQNREAVLVELLAPNGRPVQTTTDLPSFWKNTYPQVRKELRGRYPKHPWPEDPWNAQPTARTKRREP
jgi:ATP-dependent helicase HrpB